jgi:hypothetical protein
MFKQTCFVNASLVVVAGCIGLFSASSGGSEIEVRVLHKVGELDVLW